MTAANAAIKRTTNIRPKPRKIPLLAECRIPESMSHDACTFLISFSFEVSTQPILQRWSCCISVAAGSKGPAGGTFRSNSSHWDWGSLGKEYMFAASSPFCWLQRINAARAPGSQPRSVRIETTSVGPQPRCRTATGGRRIQRMARVRFTEI